MPVGNAQGEKAWQKKPCSDCDVAAIARGGLTAPLWTPPECPWVVPQVKKKLGKKSRVAVGCVARLPQRSPSGRKRAPPSSFYKSYKSYKSYASVTPPQHAHRRSHQASKALPHGKSSPEPNQTAAPQTLGVYRDAPIIIL